MRLHHSLAVAYLDKAASPSPSSSPPSISSPSLTLSSSAAIPLGALQCLRPLAPKISFPEPRKMVVLPELARVRNAARLLHCTVS